MKCPFCHRGEIRKSQAQGFNNCPHCGFVFTDSVNEDPEGKDKYDIEVFRSKITEPRQVFMKATEKYNKNGYVVIGVRPDRGNYSLLFGQSYTVLKRKAK